MGYIQIITTGGTIASLPHKNGSVSATLSGEELINKLGITGNIKVKSSVIMGSYEFDYATLYKIAIDVIEALKNKDVKGIVITHGTDTIEETSFYLSLITGAFNKPIILTGAQLDASYSFSDGVMNLKDAIRVAQFEKISESGVLVVFSSFIYTARNVKKIDTNALEGFDSPGWGAIGRVDKQDIITNRYIPSYIDLKPTIPVPVALIRLGIGMTGNEVKKMVEGYPGVVIEAFGRGNSHTTIPKEIKALINNGIPVIITTRCVRGSVQPIYVNGGGRDLQHAGAWFAGELSGEKARILLGVLLALKTPWDEMKKIINQLSRP